MAYVSWVSDVCAICGCCVSTIFKHQDIMKHRGQRRVVFYCVWTVGLFQPNKSGPSNEFVPCNVNVISTKNWETRYSNHCEGDIDIEEKGFCSVLEK